MSAAARLKSGWLIDLFYEIRHEATWVGELADPRTLALQWIVDRAVEWGISDYEEFNVDSPHLDPQRPTDMVTLQSIADLGVRVTLKSVEIAPTPTGEQV